MVVALSCTIGNHGKTGKAFTAQTGRLSIL